ncbi:DNA cytosine methyltransferase [Exiguobacterium sp. UBA3968]|uniref:DNA cytosine methyltransferase n=1 Tax=Exiguobacterium sp. UBA3968 TaxID=1946492 RepID=UPI0025C24363|nr:DNA cytosine methyltransferase [Exiguobacterium sp. UBA3968]
MKKYSVLDLFAGGGGFSTGFLNARYNNACFEIVKAVEIDKDACNTLRNHLGIDKVFEGDITLESNKELLIEECKDVDVIIGGPPCQTFSLIGPARSGKKEIQAALKNDPRNTLFRHFFDLVRRIKPRFVVFENVEGLLSKKFEDDVSQRDKLAIEVISEQLEDIGYSTRLDNQENSKFEVLNSVDYGVAQKRKRVIIVANRHNISNPLISSYASTSPQKNLLEVIGDLPFLLPEINTLGMDKLKNIDYLIDNLEICLSAFIKNILEVEYNYKKQIEEKKEEFQKLKEFLLNNIHIVKNIKKNKMDYLKLFCVEYNSLAKSFNLSTNIKSEITLHKTRKHNIRDLIMFSLMPQGSSSSNFVNKNLKYNFSLLNNLYPYDKKNHKDTYVKHSWVKPSNTILAHMQKDGLKFIHPTQPRTFTPYEASLIQSFPKNYDFSGSQNAQYRQIGNAVPPLMAKSIAKAILKVLVDYDKNDKHKGVKKIEKNEPLPF